MQVYSQSWAPFIPAYKARLSRRSFVMEETMSILFAIMALLAQWFVVTKVARTSGGKKFSASLKESFWKCFSIFCIGLPFVSLGVLLACGVHPPWACCATGTVMLVNGIFTGVFVETGLKIDG